MDFLNTTWDGEGAVETRICQSVSSPPNCVLSFGIWKCFKHTLRANSLYPLQSILKFSKAPMTIPAVLQLGHKEGN